MEVFRINNSYTILLKSCRDQRSSSGEAKVIMCILVILFILNLMIEYLLYIEILIYLYMYSFTNISKQYVTPTNNNLLK